MKHGQITSVTSLSSVWCSSADYGALPTNYPDPDPDGNVQVQVQELSFSSSGNFQECKQSWLLVTRLAFLENESIIVVTFSAIMNS